MDSTGSFNALVPSVAPILETESCTAVTCSDKPLNVFVLPVTIALISARIPARKEVDSPISSLISSLIYVLETRICATIALRSSCVILGFAEIAELTADSTAFVLDGCRSFNVNVPSSFFVNGFVPAEEVRP